ncbi:DUF427 domain-containing protein [Patulibacter defluvii]|uniref:DUF427 domain-containing protein n=1 Tax=Patulibacter defluvii TaxID=3095358 RepID=UPI002A749C08|nr:DUF427 domain-containing protein [Patulibacter sp. DM4]
MSLTLGDGPLAGAPGGRFNFDLRAASPAHQLYLQPYGPRVRAVVGGELVLDSDRAQLLYETGIPPRIYAPFEDYRGDLMTRTATTTHCPFKGDASYWSLNAGGQVVEDAIWAYEDPQPAAPWLRGLAALYPEKVEAWFAEQDRIVGHLRDPYHRVDVHDGSRSVEVRIGGTVVARSVRPKLLFETGLPPRVYVPAADVDPGAVAPGSGLRTICPYKGEASYWTVAGVEDVAWSYETPLAEAARIQTHLAFDDGREDVEVVVD